MARHSVPVAPVSSEKFWARLSHASVTNVISACMARNSVPVTLILQREHADSKFICCPVNPCIHVNKGLKATNHRALTTTGCGVAWHPDHAGQDAGEEHESVLDLELTWSHMSLG